MVLYSSRSLFIQSVSQATTRIPAETVLLSVVYILAMRDVFRTLDADGSGSLDMCELETAMASMGVECSKKEMETLIIQIDTDGYYF